MSGDRPRVEIPEHAAAAAAHADKLGNVARALHETPFPPGAEYDYAYTPDERSVVIEHNGVPCLVMSAEVFQWLRSLPPIKF